jgi:hypothetical protein
MCEWTKFRVGTPAAKGFNSDCVSLASISHVSHITSAIDIIDCREIRPSLVFDESVLNDKRILVTWLSPNYWSNGFRYGNVRFEFDFKALIQNKNYYWVESIAYKVPACRILITDENRDDILKKYNPMSGDGPWWHDTSKDIHYWNSNHCLEFMLESTVSLDALKAIDFVTHHSEWCSIHRYNQSKCKDLGLSGLRSGARFFSSAVTTDTDLGYLKDFFIDDENHAKSNLDDAISRIKLAIANDVTYAGEIVHGGNKSAPVARSVLAAIAYGRIDEAKELAAYFSSSDELYKTICNLIGDCLDSETTFPDE